ncbi:MAG: rod shape-determining protein, partial [Clostridia bacterium]|nr:rod shape-determining protein [Clostridia bacterium]
KDIYVFDVGSAATRIAKADCGILMREPTVVAMPSSGERKMLAAGREAVKLYNRFPEGITLKSPLKGGKVNDGYLLAAMLKKLFESSTARLKHSIGRRAIVPIRENISGNSKKVLLDAVKFAVSGSATAVPSILCAARGTSTYDKSFNGGTVVVDMGVKRTSAAVICFGTLCTSIELAYGACDINNMLCRYADAGEKAKQAVMPIAQMLETLFIQTPPELVGDIVDNGIVLAGGGTKADGICDMLSSLLNVKVIADDTAGDAAVLGALAMNNRRAEQKEEIKIAAIG